MISSTFWCVKRIQNIIYFYKNCHFYSIFYFLHRSYYVGMFITGILLFYPVFILMRGSLYLHSFYFATNCKKCISEDIKILDNRWIAKMLTEFRAVLSNSRMSIYTRAAHIIYFLFVVHKKLVWMCVMGILNALWMTVVGLKAEFNVNWTVVVMKCLQNLNLYD